MVVIKEHWLHGNIKFNVDIQEEDSCLECIHYPVCKRAMEEFCLNYCFGTSEINASCKGCLHRHTRLIWNPKDGIQCFRCKHFKKEEYKSKCSKLHRLDKNNKCVDCEKEIS